MKIRLSSTAILKLESYHTIVEALANLLTKNTDTPVQVQLSRAELYCGTTNEDKQNSIGNLSDHPKTVKVFKKPNG